jgi:hypothetical protein
VFLDQHEFGDTPPSGSVELPVFLQKTVRFSMLLSVIPCPQTALSGNCSQAGASGTLSIVKHTRLILLIFLFPFLASAQSPTLVQHVSCPNSNAFGSGSGGTINPTNPDYFCPLPELTQAGNTLLLGFFADNTNAPTWTLSDDKNNTWTQADSATDTHGNIFRVYYATGIAAGTHMLHIHQTAPTNGFLAVSASEYYNVGALDKASCNASSNSTSITAGSITPTNSGDLLWQWAVNAAVPEVSPFTVGSQSNINWQFLGTDIHDADAVQGGVYNSTSAINPTFTGTSGNWDSCAMALVPSTAGTLPTATFRIVHVQHAQQLSSDASTYTNQFPTSGNLLVLSFFSGGNTITGVTSTPSNTWTATGPPAGDGVQTKTQIFYAPKASNSNSLTYSVTQSGTLTGTTFMMYDVVGANASPFDKDSGGQSGVQTAPSGDPTLTTCSGCFTPTNANELVVGNFGEAWCSSTNLTAPSGGLFDAAYYTGNTYSGPQSVDQNNGWFHFYNPSATPETVTWQQICGSNSNNNAWGGRVAAFMSASSGVQKPTPPSGLKAVVN